MSNIVYSDIIYIDDTVAEDSLDGKKVKNIVASKNYSITFINGKTEIDTLLQAKPEALKPFKLVLLDLDLSKMKTDAKKKKADAEEILTALVKKKVKVIMLSALPKTSATRKKKGHNEYQQELPSMSRLYNKGALAYIYKSELGERDDFIANTIDHTIKDPDNSKYNLILDPKLAYFRIVDNEENELVKKRLSVNANWTGQLELSTTSWDAIMRILFEMGKTNEKEIKISDVYGEELKTLRKLMPEDFQKILGVFNDEIRDKSDGLIVGRLLQGGGHGDRSGTYKANIGQVRLEYQESRFVDIDWKASVEKRLSFLENELRKIRKSIPS